MSFYTVGAGHGLPCSLDTVLSIDKWYNLATTGQAMACPYNGGRNIGISSEIFLDNQTIFMYNLCELNKLIKSDGGNGPVKSSNLLCVRC